MNVRAVLFTTTLSWLLYCAAATSFSYANPDFIPGDFVAYGTGVINGSGLAVSQEGDIEGAIIFYNQPVVIANGFTTQFTIEITNCDISYGGADGFAFVLFPQQLPAQFSPPVGSAIGITDSSNLAAVGFILVSDILTVCAANSASNLGHGSLKDDTVHCVQNDTSSDSAMKNLRCTGPHSIGITFTSPATWEIVIDGTASYTFTKDIMQILNWNSGYTGYVGFSGGVAAGYMNQQITNWSFTTTAGCIATCDPAATCDVFTNNNTVVCSCPNGYFGDGTIPCIPIRTNNVIPILECFESYGDSIYEAFYGYNSLENVTVAIPKGVDNDFYGYGYVDFPDIFEPGRTGFYPASAFSVELEAADPLTLTWHLGNHEVTFTTNETSKLCPSSLTILLQFVTSRRLDANETALILDQLYNLLGLSYGRISVLNITYVPYTSKRQSSEELAELELEISATNDTTSNEPRASQAVQRFISASSNTTLMNEIVNPNTEDPDPSRNFVDVKTTSTGTETLGQVLPTPTSIVPIVNMPPEGTESPSNSPSPNPQQTNPRPSRPSAVSAGFSKFFISNIIAFIVLLNFL